MAEKLTEGLIKTLKPPHRGSLLIWDTELTGFALRVFAPSKTYPGGARTFLLSYWLNGIERRYRIGSWPDWSVMAARAEARGIRQRVDRGEDPADERRQRREAATMADLAERYKREHLPRKAQQSQRDDSTMIGHILRHIGADRRVADVHNGDIVALHRAITDSGHPVLANRTVACASGMFSLALKPMAGEDKPWRDQAQGNPCKGIERNPEQAKERFLSPAEIAAAVEALDAYGRTSAADCVRLIMLTGCRPGEAMCATWSQFDAQPGFWIKPSTHTKQRREHRLPLSAPARQLIADIRSRRGDVELGDYVFPGPRPGQHQQQLRRCWDAVCKHAGLHQARIYDLRHTFAAMGAGGGLGLPLIGRLLGHTQARTTQRYAHLADDPLREAADKIASAITKAWQGGKVVKLRGAHEGRRISAQLFSIGTVIPAHHSAGAQGSILGAGVHRAVRPCHVYFRGPRNICSGNRRKREMR
jgi:integrase